jgi:poly-gamma-glutamate biosynthesis protein PgsC/CapC
MIYETLIIGILIAVLYTEITNVFPGGIIVPAYTALYLDEPLRVLMTIVIAFLSLFTYRWLSRSLILFGKRRFVMFILLGVVWAQLWIILLPYVFKGPSGLKAIGLIIPGLLANNLEKQPTFFTLASLVIVSIIIYASVRIIGWIIP